MLPCNIFVGSFIDSSDLVRTFRFPPRGRSSSRAHDQNLAAGGSECVFLEAGVAAGGCSRSEARSCYLSGSSRFGRSASFVILTVNSLLLEPSRETETFCRRSGRDGWTRVDPIIVSGFSSWLWEAFNLIGSSCGTRPNSKEFSSLLLHLEVHFRII